MENNYNIMPIFSTPIYVGKIPQSFSNITSFFNNQKMKDLDISVSDNYGQRSYNSYILDEPECAELRNFILKQVTEYGSNYFNYNYDSYKISQSWISIKEPGQSHMTHSHANSLISGVLYYGKYSINTPSIIFHSPQTSYNSVTTGVLMPKMKPTPPTTEWAFQGIAAYSPSPGDLLLFPSSLPHSVPMNESNELRKSLAFNVIPTEGFGEEISLTELKFN